MKKFRRESKQGAYVGSHTNVHTSLAVGMLATHTACKQNKLPGMLGAEKRT